MNRATDQSSTHIWAAEALELLVAVYGSIPTAERVLLRELKAGRMPWTAVDVDPPGMPIDELWQKGTLEARLAQNEATFKEPFVLSGSPDVGFDTIKVGGIQVERVAVAALLPAGSDETLRRLLLPTDGAGAPAEGEDAPANQPPGGAPPQAPRPERPPSLGRQRTGSILEKLYPNEVPREHVVATADIIKAIKVEWRVVPNPQHVRLPSDNTLRDVIKNRRPAEKQRVS